MTNEWGRAAMFTVALASPPTADVTIPLASSNPGEGSVSPSSLTFTTSTWNVAQTVTVTGVDDLLEDGAVSYLVQLLPATSGDPAYSGLDGSDVTVSNQDNDSTERINVSTAGVVGNKDSVESIRTSTSGRFVLFASSASNLVPDDTNDNWDLFLRDRQEGTTTRVSVATGNVQIFSAGTWGDLTPDGRYVVFEGSGYALPGQNGIYRHDRTTGETVLVSAIPEETTIHIGGAYPSISSDGDIVAFDTNSDVFPNPSPFPVTRVHIKHMTTGQLEVIPLANLTDDSQWFHFPRVSADGRFVVFAEVPPGIDAHQIWNRQVYRYNIATKVTELVSVRPDGLMAGSEGADFGEVSADGRYIAFHIHDPAFLGPSTPGTGQLYVRDMTMGSTLMISTSSTGEPADNDCFTPRISADGRRVTFTSRASNLGFAKTDDRFMIFAKDLDTGAVDLVSHSVSGEQGNDYSFFAAISPDGQMSCYLSDASNLVPGDTPGSRDVFCTGTH